MLEFWSAGKLGFWNAGMLESWSAGGLGFWNAGMLEDLERQNALLAEQE